MYLQEIALLPPYFETKRLLKKTEYWPRQKLISLQREKLFALLKYVTSTVSFYKRYKDILEKVDDPFLMIKEFPIIDKSYIKKHIDNFVAGPKWRLLKATTAGSTGQPFAFYMDRFRTRQIEKAFIFDMWSRVGYKFGDPIFNLRGRVPKKNNFVDHDRLFNVYYASSFNLNASTIRHYVEFLNEKKPKFLHGYPSTMYQLVMLMEDAGLNLNYKPMAVLCGSEKLFDFQRKAIDNKFSTRCFSWYGHSEYLVLAGECEFSKKFHLYPQYGYTEFIPSKLKDINGRPIYEIVATGFNNPVMPLIRYKTGDYAILADNIKCKCNRHYQLIDEIIGRQHEFIVDKDGNIISGTSLIAGNHFAIYEGMDGLYIVQREKGKIDVKIKKNEYFKQDQFTEMKEKIADFLGQNFEVQYSFVDVLPRTEAGKSRLIDQHLNIEKFMK